MWHPFQADFPQQNDCAFERGPLSLQAGELVWVIRLGAGQVVLAAEPAADQPAWLHLASFHPRTQHHWPVLGRWNQRPVLVEPLRPARTPDANWVDLRSQLLQATSAEFDLLTTAAGLAAWATEQRFCGRCGHKTQRREDEYAMQCPRCHLRQYPRVAPCMITLVWRPGELLLARSPRFSPGVYSTLAGFVETGESIEQAVHREVKEEVGLEVGALKYLGSQAWPFPHSLMFGFWAEYRGGTLKPDPQELEDARWFAFDQLPELPPRPAISRVLIDNFLRWQQENLPKTPVIR